MLVGDRFEGDDMVLAWAQHDLYGQALLVVQNEVRLHARWASSLLGLSQEAWYDVPSIDHRTLQDAHDVLAAAWRYRVVAREGDMLRRTGSLPAMGWLEWLREEVRGWRDVPDLVRLVLTITREQNTGTGYDAEDELRQRLVERFAEVPWR